MAKCIKINSCKDCPFLRFGGGFGSVPYRPMCGNASNKVLPYTLQGNRAQMTGEIPEWCSLAAYPEQPAAEEHWD